MEPLSQEMEALEEEEVVVVAAAAAVRLIAQTLKSCRSNKIIISNKH